MYLGSSRLVELCSNVLSGSDKRKGKHWKHGGGGDEGAVVDIRYMDGAVWTCKAGVYTIAIACSDGKIR